MAKTIHMLWVYTMTTASRDRECSFYKHLPQETLLISFKQSSQGSNTSFTIWDCYLKTRLSCGMARKVGGTNWAEHSCERQRKKKSTASTTRRKGLYAQSFRSHLWWLRTKFSFVCLNAVLWPYMLSKIESIVDFRFKLRFAGTWGHLRVRFKRKGLVTFTL